MPIYYSIFLGGLLITGLTTNFQTMGQRFTKQYHSNLAIQQLLVQELNLTIECTSDINSPSPGCGRRE